MRASPSSSKPIFRFPSDLNYQVVARLPSMFLGRGSKELDTRAEGSRCLGMCVRVSKCSRKWARALECLNVWDELPKSRPCTWAPVLPTRDHRSRFQALPHTSRFRTPPVMCPSFVMIPSPSLSFKFCPTCFRLFTCYVSSLEIEGCTVHMLERPRETSCVFEYPRDIDKT